MQKAHPSVVEVRSIGLFAAVELVRDQETREPLGALRQGPRRLDEVHPWKAVRQGFMTYTHEK
jgi:adenosylmethionine-8-amino-7-oxononanoate aminotransferase